MTSLLKDLLQLQRPCPDSTDGSSGGPIKAVAWARVSTGQQEARGLSIPQQFRDIQVYAEKEGIQIVRQYSEAVSAFRRQHKRTEFQRMIADVRADSTVRMILVHDLSRFHRDSEQGKALKRQLAREGIKVVSLNDPDFDPETSAGVYMEAFTFAKNEAFSRDVAFHTHNGCRANIQARDDETGWCYKNGGQPLFGYRAERLVRGEIKRGRPLTKIIWVPDETVVAGRPMHEWARYCLLELVGNGASLDQVRDFCNNTGIPGRRKQYWGTSTWYALLQPSVLLQFCGYGVWNVRTKTGRERPPEEWIIVPHAHAALISEEEAIKIIQARKAVASERQQFGSGMPSRSHRSPYLLSGGPFRCDRCGANMIGFHSDSGTYYVCGSQPYRRGMGCGPGVYVPKDRVESEVLGGLQDVLGLCADPRGFSRRVNDELKTIWESSTGVRADSGQRVAAIDKKIENIRRAVEDGLQDAGWANQRLRELLDERQALASACSAGGSPPQIDAATIMTYRRQTDKLFKCGDPGDRKRLLRMWVQEIRLKPEDLEVSITYRLPESVMNGVVAGGGFEPPTFGL